MMQAASHDNPNIPHQRYQYECHIGGNDEVSVIKARTRVPGLHEANQIPVAIKCYKKNRNSTAKRFLQREVLALRKVTSNRVTALHEVFTSSFHICLVMEYMGGGTLHDYIREHRGGLGEAIAKKLFHDVVIGIRDIHAHNIANRDIKAQNVVLDETKHTAKICDLGYARLHYSECVTKLGSPYYQAPEIWSLSYNEAENRPYDGRRVDVWSLGILLYNMLFGQFPFDLEKEGSSSFHTSSSWSRRHAALGECLFSLFVVQIVQRGEFDFPPNASVSQSCCNLVRRMLTVDFRNRIEVDQILTHEWFRQDRNFANFAQPAAPQLCYQSESILMAIINDVRIDQSTEVIEIPE